MSLWSLFPTLRVSNMRLTFLLCSAAALCYQLPSIDSHFDSTLVQSHDIVGGYQQQYLSFNGSEGFVIGHPDPWNNFVHSRVHHVKEWLETTKEKIHHLTKRAVDAPPSTRWSTVGQSQWTDQKKYAVPTLSNPLIPTLLAGKLL